MCSNFNDESKENSDGMNDPKKWFQNLDHDAKEENIQMKTELINKTYRGR
jgi:hypothetical protein